MFTDLPDDVLFILADYLDGLSILALSETCARFYGFFNQNVVVRKFSFNPIDRVYPENEGPLMMDLRKLIDKNNRTLTSLDLSYLKWGYFRNIVNKSLKKLPLTKLNVIGSDLKKNILEKNNLKNLAELSFSSHPREFIVIPFNLKKLTIYFNYKTEFSSSLPINIEKSVDKLTVICDNFTFLPNGIARLLKLRLPEIVIKLIEPYNISFKTLLQCIPQFSLPSTNIHCIFEALTCICMSSQLYKETSNCSSLVKKLNIEDYGSQTIVNIHIFNVSTPEEFQYIVDKAKSIIHTRSTKNISLYGREYCVRNGFDTVEYLSKIPNIEYLTLQKCSLAVKLRTELNYTVLKKARVSRIMSKPEEGDILERVSNVHKNLKGLQIMSTISHSCSTVGEQRSVGLHYESFLKFKNLKFLTIDHKLIVSDYFYSKIFEALVYLEVLNIQSSCFATSRNLHMLNELPRNLYLARNLKILRFHDSLGEINTILREFTECPSLKVIDFQYKSLVMKKIHPLVQLPSIDHVLKECPNISYLRLVDVDLLKSHQTLLRKVERSVKELFHKIIIVNLTSSEYFMNYNLNALGEFI